MITSRLAKKYVDVAYHEMRVLLKETLSSLSSQVVILRVLLTEPLSSLSSEVIIMTMKLNGNPMDLYFSKISNYLRIYFVFGKRSGALNNANFANDKLTKAVNICCQNYQVLTSL